MPGSVDADGYPPLQGRGHHAVPERVLTYRTRVVPRGLRRVSFLLSGEEARRRFFCFFRCPHGRGEGGQTYRLGIGISRWEERNKRLAPFRFYFLHCAWGGQEDSPEPSCQSPRQRGSPLDSPPRARTRAAIICRYHPSGTGLEDSSVLFSPAGGETKLKGALTAVR